MHSLDYLRVQVRAFPRVTYIMIHLAMTLCTPMNRISHGAMLDVKGLIKHHGITSDWYLRPKASLSFIVW